MKPLSLILILTLAGCGGYWTSVASDDATPTTQPAETRQQDTLPTTQDAVSDAAIEIGSKLGYILPGLGLAVAVLKYVKAKRIVHDLVKNFDNGLSVLGCLNAKDEAGHAVDAKKILTGAMSGQKPATVDAVRKIKTKLRKA